MCQAACFVLSFGAALADATTASAQTSDELFQDLLERPGDADLTIRYAEAAAAEGDYETAVSALERLLLVDGSLSAVKVRLGILYLRMESPGTARRYLVDALDDPGLPDQVAEAAERALAEASNAEQRHQISGSVYAGFRWQSNANSGPNEDAARDAAEAGGGAAVDPDDLARAEELSGDDDGNGFVLGTVRHTFDLQTQNFAAMETRALFYGTRHIDQTDLDTEAFEASTGLRFAPLPDSAPNATIRPFVWTQYVRRDDDSLRLSFGGGVDGQFTPDPQWLIDWTLQVAYNDYFVTDTRELADERDSISVRGRATGYYALTRNQVVSVGAGVTRNSAEEDFNNFTRGRLSLGYSYRFEPPFEFVLAPWRLSVSAEGSVTGYDEPDPVIDPDTTRHDLRGLVQVTQEVGLADDLALVFEGSYERSYSNIPLYDYDNASGSVGVRYRF